ncbi:MAG TPA: cupin [Chloroflexota bacterium]|jgi:1,2-dihydroxy-3-keto-5-methylthiopentene dioxygenase
MTKLIVLPENDPATTLTATTDPAEIAAALAPVGVRYEQWTAAAPLAPSASQDEVLAAYRADVERLCAEGGYVTVDVARLHGDPNDPTWPTRAAEARNKFLAEHTHADDEVRFFVEGQGAFYLRLHGRVHIVCCEAGDLLSVPAGTRHWFDMGTNPSFAAIRSFREPEGWVGAFTGDTIATRFPAFDDLVSPVAR